MQEKQLSIGDQLVPFATLDEMYQSGSEVPAVPIASWEETSERGRVIRKIKTDKAVALAPSTAVRYAEKSFFFPTATVRELVFTASEGGVLRQITDETVVFVLSGSCRLETDGESIDLEEEDLVFLPKGELQGSDDATLIAWSVENTFTGAPEGTTHDDLQMQVVRKADRKMKDKAEWEENGDRKVMEASHPLTDVPEGAIRLRLDMYPIVGNVFALVTGFEGGPTFEYKATWDNYLYIRSGSYRYFQDDVEFEARPGDVIREIGGHPHHWIRHEDSSFLVATSMPVILPSS